MNNTILKEQLLSDMKLLVSKMEKKEKRISSICKEIMCFGNDDNLNFELRMKTQKYLKLSKKLNKLIKKL